MINTNLSFAGTVQKRTEMRGPQGIVDNWSEGQKTTKDEDNKLLTNFNASLIENMGSNFEHKKLPNDTFELQFNGGVTVKCNDQEISFNTVDSRIKINAEEYGKAVFNVIFNNIKEVINKKEDFVQDTLKSIMDCFKPASDESQSSISNNSNNSDKPQTKENEEQQYSTHSGRYRYNYRSDVSKNEPDPWTYRD